MYFHPSSLKALAERLGVGDRVMLPGLRTDIVDLLMAFDVFVHPAIAESFGMVIIEAMATGRPVLSTRVGIAPEVIETGRTGVLCSADTPQALAQGLRQMLALRSTWDSIGQAARLRVQGFTAIAMAARYQQLYRRWLRERKVGEAPARLS